MIFMMISVNAGFGQHIRSLTRPQKLKALQVRISPKLRISQL